jgi:hypothetical protein
MDFGEVLWLIIISFAFFAYLMVMLNIVTDLFRDKETSGVLKAVWIIALIFVPFLTAVIYLVSRGQGMAERQSAAVYDMKASQDAYIKSVASSASPADQIAQARSLLDSGAITQEEFEALKAKALA